jgi:hypothetical protein
MRYQSFRRIKMDKMPRIEVEFLAQRVPLNPKRCATKHETMIRPCQYTRVSRLKTFRIEKEAVRCPPIGVSLIRFVISS